LRCNPFLIEVKLIRGPVIFLIRVSASAIQNVLDFRYDFAKLHRSKFTKILYWKIYVGETLIYIKHLTECHVPVHTDHVVVHSNSFNTLVGTKSTCQCSERDVSNAIA